MGNIWTCASASRNDVNDYAGDGAHAASVVDGDEIVIPGENVSWTSGVDVTKALWIHGEIAGVTNDASGRTTATTTKIRNNRADRGRIFSFNTALGKNWRLSHMELADDAETALAAGGIGVSGYSRDWMIDHVLFNMNHTDRCVFWLDGASFGLIKFCTANVINQFITPAQPSWGGVGLWGDQSWATANDWGSRSFAYVEDCKIVGSHTGWCDGYQGARWYVRFSEIHDAQVVSHGTESSHRERGTRAVGYAFCTAQDSAVNDFDLMFLRSGVAFMAFITSTNFYDGVKGYDYRMVDGFSPWGRADGTGAFDTAINGAYDSGTYNGTDNVETLLTDTTKSWTSNQWAPTGDFTGYGYGGSSYVVTNLTRGWSSFVLANDAHTITLVESLYYPSGIPNHTWRTGDSYEIRQVNQVLDQVGYGMDTGLTGGDADHAPTPSGWPTQNHERCYSFAHTPSNADGFYAGRGGSPNIQVSRDIIIDRSAASRPAGPAVDVGTYAAMQAAAGSAVSGDGWWVTDRGSWNAGTNSIYTGQGQFWIFNGSIWVLNHEPLTYPHPTYTEWTGGTIPRTVTTKLFAQMIR